MHDDVHRPEDKWLPMIMLHEGLAGRGTFGGGRGGEGVRGVRQDKGRCGGVVPVGIRPRSSAAASAGERHASRIALPHAPSSTQ